MTTHDAKLQMSTQRSDTQIPGILDEIRTRIRGKNIAKIVFVSGNFNVLHPGHVRLLKFAAECGDFLVVGVHGQGSSGATLPEDLRLEGVRAISMVDYAFLLKEPAESFIARLRPAIVVKGKEFEDHDNPELPVVESYGGRLLFGSGEARFSSTELLRREYLEVNRSTIRKPTDFADRHNFRIADLKVVLDRLKGLKVLVIGDLIVDEYIDCDPLGMSQEDPTIVVTPIERKTFVGGAGIVAAHARGLGADVSFFTVAGLDPSAQFAQAKLEDYGVKSTILPDDSRPTTLKQRYRAAGKTLLRVSHLRQRDVRPEIAAQILRQVEQQIDEVRLIVFADFNYGCLPQPLVDEVVRMGRERGVMTVADSQASSQVSDVSRFPGTKLLTPTEREARLALRDSDSGLAVVAEALSKKARAENVVLTLGAEGLLIYASQDRRQLMDRLPAFNTAPKDTAGAGDCLLACTSLALCAGEDIWKSVYLGSLAAACQVARVGNAPLTQDDLFAEIDHP